jgi:uncharacterized protein
MNGKGSNGFGRPRRWVRREVLGTLAAGATLPLTSRAGAALPRVGVVGAGMAGVALAWLLDGEREVVLLEAGAGIGGNVQSVPLEIDGQPYRVDIGAQFFHPGPYPTYVALLQELGLYPPAPGGARSFPASITVAAPGEATPRFVSPVLPGRGWPLLAPWNLSGVQAFATVFRAAKRREEFDAPWELTLGDWLPTLGLSTEQVEGIVLPWAASLFSGDIEQARTLSARAAMVFAAKALPEDPLAPLEYFVLEQGLIDALERMVSAFSTVSVLTNTPVESIERADTGFTVRADGGLELGVEQLVLATSGPPALALLEGVPGTLALRLALQGMEFHDARLMLHTDAAYPPGPNAVRSFLNCEVNGAYCESSMWLADVLPPGPNGAPALWKSWTTFRDTFPSAVLHETSFVHMLPTPATLQAQTRLARAQGTRDIWVAGGFTAPYDSQETALLSALDIAEGLGVSTARTQLLRTAV